MNTKNFTIAFLIALFFVMPAIIPKHALAEEKNSTNNTNEELDFLDYEDEDPTLPEDKENKFKFKYIEKMDFEQRIMEAIPYSKQAKYMWNVVDGDVDIYFENLRMDRRNKGLVYTTNTMPFIGEIEDIEFKFKAGEEMKVTFETGRVPFVGKLEGFKFKGSVGDNTKVSVRYTIPLDFK